MKTRLLIPIIFLMIFACKSENKPGEIISDQNKTQSELTNSETTIKTNTDTMENKTDEKDYYVKLSTSYGDMVIKLYNETPKHRDNFLKLVKEGYYNDLLFHKVIKDFMIQGGDPQSKNAGPKQQLGSGGPGYTIPAEFNNNLIHKKGALSAARLGGPSNPQKESSGSQFYIVLGKTFSDAELSQMELRGKKYTEEQKKIYREIGGYPPLDNDYTVFGEVISGLDVIDKIAAVKTAPGDRPLQDVKMKMEIVEK